jgi:hypothetical protein
MNYECHITIDLKDAEMGKFYVINVEDFGRDGEPRQGSPLVWKHSEIARDPLLGEKSFFYLTCHDSDVERIFKRMRYATQWLEGQNVKVLREKIELIVFDTKTSKV